MKCSKCNSEVPDGVKFCPNCGNEMGEIKTAKEATSETVANETKAVVEQSEKIQEPVQDPIKSEPQTTFQPLSGVSATAGNTKNKKSKAGIVVFFIVLLLLLAVAGGAVFYYFQFLTNPTSFYKKTIEKTMNAVFEETSDINDVKSIKAGISVDADINLNKNALKLYGISQDAIDIINNVDLALEVQADKDSEQAVFKINSDYKDDTLLNAEVYMDAKKEIAYVYSKELYDKYIKLSDKYVDLDDLNFEEMFEIANVSIDYKKVNKILTKELQSIVKDKYCSKEINGLNTTYTLKLKYGEMAKELTTVLTNLQGNDEFIGCFGDYKSTVKQLLKSFEKTLSNVKEDNDSMTFMAKIYTSGINQEVKEVLLKMYADESKNQTASIDIKIKSKDTAEFKIEFEGQEICKFTIKYEKKSDSEKNVEFGVSVSEIGDISLKIGTKIEKNVKIDTVDDKKAEDVDNIDAEKLIKNLEKSKIVDLVEDITGEDITKILKQNTQQPVTPTVQPTTSEVSNEIKTYDNKVTVKFGVPTGFKSIYASENYKSFGNDQYEVTFKSSYDKVDNYIKSLENKVKNYSTYKDVKLSETKQIEVNGKKFTYGTISYTYAGYTTTNYSNDFIAYEIPNSNYIFVVETKAKNGTFSEEMLKEMLNIEIK